MFLYAVIISCLCALFLEVIKSNMASLSLPGEHKARLQRLTSGAESACCYLSIKLDRGGGHSPIPFIAL